MITLKRVDGTDLDFMSLVRYLDAELAITDGDEHAFYDQFNKIEGIKYVVVAYDGNKPVGCGAIKAFDTDAMEVKRMYTATSYRSIGIGGKILRELEKWATSLEYKSLVLETGTRQPDAIGLYTKWGYQKIPKYGQYRTMENSLCFKKNL